MRSRKRRWRPKLAAPEPLEGVLERAGENRFAKRQLPVPLAHWRSAVGPRIADRARPVALERGVLVIKVVSSVWANELSMLAPQIIERLAQSRSNGGAGVTVQSLRFRVGPLEVLEGIPQVLTHRRVPPPAPLTPELARALATVEDDDLRRMIERAARGNLAWLAAPPELSGAPRDARDLLAAGTESAPPDRTEGGSGAASRRTPGADSDRRR